MCLITMNALTLILYIVTTVLFMYTTALYWYAYYKGGRNTIILGYTILLSVMMLDFMFNAFIYLFRNSAINCEHYFIVGLVVCITLLYFIKISFQKPRLRKLIKR